ncbi:MAG: DUF2298 domain-containing protein [Chloroflexi bacterium]|nr:DUF2298 domain-containing protein [Chloroflexota bacterium]
MRNKVFATILLAAILIYGGALRFSGHNWDDFSHTHPDELFLTLLVLPNLGGSNSFTADESQFPKLQLLALRDSTAISSRADISDQPAIWLGVVRESFAATAGEWLVGRDRMRVFDAFSMAESALLAGAVDALLADPALLPTHDEVMLAGLISSVELQGFRCRNLYPDTGGSGGFFDARCSPLNPHNAGHGFFVYGTLPLLLAHFGGEIVRSATDADLPVFDFQGGHLVWRGISMIFDILSIVMVFALGSRMHNRWVGLLAAVFYASAPLAIQKAHFGTVNAIAAFFVIFALYSAVRVQQQGRLTSYLLFGIACGMAVASRINLAPLAGIIVVSAALQAMPAFSDRLAARERRTLVARHLFGLLLAGFGAFLAFRVCNPYAFTGPGFFGLLPNERWLANLAQVSLGVGGIQDYPPNWQWLARSALVYVSKDLLLWGMGLSFGALGCFGWFWATYRVLRNRPAATANLTLIIWIAGYLLWMGRLWTLTMRYYLPLYGAMAVMAGWCLYELCRYAKLHRRSLPITSWLLGGFGAVLAVVGAYQVAIGVIDTTGISALCIGIMLLGSAVLSPANRYRPLILGAFAIGFALLWGLMHGNIYRHQTTLVQASRYIFERIPGDFAMKIEGVADAVPIINIAVGGTGIGIPEMSGAPFDRATMYREDEPVRVRFVPPASGTVSSIFAPHLADPLDDEQPEEVVIRIYASDSDSPAAEAVLKANLSRELHPLGASYSIPFVEAFEVEAGQSYEFELTLAPGSGDVMGSGSVVLTEGDWDNRVTGIRTCQLPDGMTLADDPPPGLLTSMDCRATQADYRLINAQDQIMSFPVDNRIKYDDILRTLEIGDYLTIASNRFYDSETRNPKRWPLTTLYYKKLFAGELGYDLIATFDETFEWGPWRVSDQHLPIYDSPAWLNELEADEAFHVYDHPAVFIFRKSPDYSRELVEATLAKVSLKQVHELHDSDDEAALLGVFYWSSAEADPVPTALTFAPEEYETQKSGGAWSARFFSDSIINRNQVVGALAWYATIFVFGALAFPPVFALFPALADGGYAVCKLAGMLLVASVAWALSSLKIPIWSQAGILFSLVLLTALSAVLGYRRRSQLKVFFRKHWRRLAWIELIGIVAFAAMILVRLTNPDLWHPYKGGEKPMDFAYLSGVLRSTTFPPIDPWFAGGFINYYYFGYVLLGAPTLLLGVVPAFAYNLMIPTVFSLTGLGAFAIAFNVLSHWRASCSRSSRSPMSARRKLGNPWVAGVMALMLCVVLGNLDTVRVLGNGIAYLGGYQKPEGLESFLTSEYSAEHGIEAPADVRAELADRAGAWHPWDRLRYEIDSSVSLVGGLLRGLGKALAGEPLPIGSDRWYWGPSRVLAETPGVGGGAITEMPFFTFLYGDLHAHMISMPLILLSVLFLFNEVAQAESDQRSSLERFLALALGALTVGVLQATNTWDWPTMTLLAVAGLGYAWWLRWRSTFRSLNDRRFYASLFGALILAAALLTFLIPAGGSSFNGAWSPMTNIAGTLRLLLLGGAATVALVVACRFWLVRSSTLALLGRVGGFILLNVAFALPYTSWYAATYNSIRLWDGGKTPLWAYFDIHGLFLFLILSLLIWDTAKWLRATRVSALIANKALAKTAGGAGIIGCLLAVVLAMAGYQVALVVLPMIVWIALLFFRPGQTLALRFTLVLIGLALSLTLGVEVIVIGGDIGRQNTVFKFYMQVWLLLSVAGGVAFACLLRATEDFSKTLRIIWYTPCVLLVFIAGLFPIMGTRGRSFDRLAPDLPLTLNGLDYMTQSRHYESAPHSGEGAWIDLSVDHKLIRWLQENVSGSPVIIEGRRRPSEYQWNGRISISTGLPSVLGWNFHQRQQRTFHPMPSWVDQREKNILQFYNTADIDIAVDIIRHFDIKYIIRSGLEEVHSTAHGLAKFERMVAAGLLDIAFVTEGGIIYEVNEEAMFHYLVERER